ncbi:MAG: hypothetical protein ACE5F7_09640 [Nitrospiria bacterium]
MGEKETEESILSKFSNQDPASGGYGEREDAEAAPSAKPRISVAKKAKRKSKNKAARQSRKKNRR